MLDPPSEIVELVENAGLRSQTRWFRDNPGFRLFFTPSVRPEWTTFEFNYPDAQDLNVSLIVHRGGAVEGVSDLEGWNHSDVVKLMLSIEREGVELAYRRCLRQDSLQWLKLANGEHVVFDTPVWTMVGARKTRNVGGG